MKFRDILSQLNIPIAPAEHHHCRPGWIQIDCPYCGRDSHRWHMGYSTEDNYLNCWRCGHHSLINTLMNITHAAYPQIKKLLDDLDVSYVPREKPIGELTIPKNAGQLQHAHKRYLERRGFDWKEILRLWNIGGIGMSSKLSWRIFIPIIYHSKTVSWTTRTISKNENVTRYISASLKQESMPHHDLLYGEDYARHGIIINEGVTNAWKIGPGAVATFGVGYSQAQVLRMIKYPVRAVCFDNEGEAQKRAKKLVDDLSAFPGDTYNVVLGKKDAAESSMKEIRRLRKEILE